MTKILARIHRIRGAQVPFGGTDSPAPLRNGSSGIQAGA